MTGISASIPEDVGLLLALKRVQDGHVFVRGAELVTERGHPFPGVLVPFVRMLFEHGHARADKSEAEHGKQQVLITTLGKGFLLELEAIVPIAEHRGPA